MQKVFSFLKALTGPAKFCCLIMIAGALISGYSWLPLQWHIENLLIYIILATMASLALGFMSMGGLRLIALQNCNVQIPTIQLPKIYWQLVIVAFIYFLVVFFGTFIFYPHGVDLGPTVNLRIASSASFFMSTAAMGFTQWAGLRFRAIHAAL